MASNMEHGPLVSVIVPAYNVERYIELCVHSILQQRYSNFEIVLVDDASTDQTSTILDALDETDPRIRVIHLTENGGPLAARASGIVAAQGEFVAFVDGDDFVHQDFLFALVGALIRTSADIAMCGAARVDENGDVIDPKFIEYRASRHVQQDHFAEFCKRRFGTGVLWNKIYRRQCISEAFGKDIDPGIQRGEDYLLNLAAFYHARSIVLIPENYYFYRQRVGSITSAERVTGFAHTLCTYANALEIFSSEPEHALRSIDELYARLLRYYQVPSEAEDPFAQVRADLASSLTRLGAVRPEAVYGLINFCEPEIQPVGLARLVKAGLHKVRSSLKWT